MLLSPASRDAARPVMPKARPSNGVQGGAMAAVEREDGASKVQQMSGKVPGTDHGTIPLPCVAQRCRPCAGTAEGQGAAKPECIPLSGTGGSGQLSVWLRVKG